MRARRLSTILVRVTKQNIMKDQFALKKPCSNCPFRKDGNAIMLVSGRKEEIIEALLNGTAATFPCHKTVYRKDGRNHDDNGQYKPVDISHCPGAMAVCRKFGRDPQVVQVATRLGFIEEDHYTEAEAGTLSAESLLIDRQKAYI